MKYPFSFTSGGTSAPFCSASIALSLSFLASLKAALIFLPIQMPAPSTDGPMFSPSGPPPSSLSNRVDPKDFPVFLTPPPSFVAKDLLARGGFGGSLPPPGGADGFLFLLPPTTFLTLLSFLLSFFFSFSVFGVV